MPIYLLQSKKKCSFDLVSQKRLKSAKSVSNRTYSVESLQKINSKNRNNNHSTKHSYSSSFSFSSISSNRESSGEALAQITDLDYNFEYNLDDLTTSSVENNLNPSIFKPVIKNSRKKPNQPKKSSNDKQTKFKPTSSSLSANGRSMSNFFNSFKCRKSQTSTETPTSVSSLAEKSNQSLNFSFNFTHGINLLYENLNLKSLSKREKKFFNFLLNLLLVLLLILMLFYYFLSMICSAWNVATRVKIENENIYIKL